MQRIGTIALVIAAGVGASACVDDGYGYRHGYTSVSVGVGGAYDPYWGWYGDYYYPGTGYYVYDQYRHPRRWTDGERLYWEGRARTYRGGSARAERWDGFDRRGGGNYRGRRR